MSKQDAVTRAEELIVLLDISEFSDRVVHTYSGGQRRRLDVALGLMNHPAILFLDEPTTGLDPQNRANLWTQIKKLQQEGTTIFITTHYLEEADALCDYIAIIDGGVIVAEGTPDELKKQVAGECITISIENSEKKSAGLISAMERADFICEIKKDDEHIKLYVNDGAKAISEVMRILDEQKINLTKISLSVPSLDDVFLHQTGHSLRDINAQGGAE
jgi:ABC-2 type transport system ATP-binding protein